MGTNPFDFSRELGALKTGATWGKWVSRGLRTWTASRQREELTERYGAETAEAIIQAIIARRNPAPLIERAERLKKERQEREELV